jgi:hypothetical protein
MEVGIILMGSLSPDPYPTVRVSTHPVLIPAHSPVQFFLRLKADIH